LLVAVQACLDHDLTWSSVILNPKYAETQPRFTLAWQLDNQNTTIEMVLRLDRRKAPDAKRWMSVGFNPGKRVMWPTDIIVCEWQESGNFTVYDMFSNGYTKPPSDTYYKNGQYNILSSSGNQTVDYSECTFSRNLDTGDNVADAIITEGNYPIIWAFGLNNTLAWHGRSDHGTTSVQFY